MLLFAFSRGGFSTPRTRKEFLPRQSLLWLRGRSIGALRAERQTLISAEWTSFSACHELLCSRAFLFIVLRSAQHPQIPRFCANFPRNLANAPLPPESFRTCFVAPCTRIPTSARSIGICVIWVCISSSFLPCRRMELLDRKRRNSSTLSFNTSRLPVCSVCATATKTLTRLGTPHGSRHSGVNGFPLQVQLQMRPSLTASYRGILFFNKMALLLPRRHRALVSTNTTPS